MPTDARSGGVLVVALIAAVLGLFHLVGGTYGVLTEPRTTAPVVLAGSRTILGGFLLLSSVGIVRTTPWGRWVGAVSFGGVAVVQLLPLLAGLTLAVPLAGVLLSGTCALYLLLASDSFGDSRDERPISEDTDPHDFVR